MNSQMENEHRPGRGNKMPSKGHKEVTHMKLRGAKGGVISETHHRTFRGGQGGGPDFDMGSDDAIHPSMGHLIGHIKKTMGHHFGNPMPEKEDSMPEGGEPPTEVKMDAGMA